MTTTTHTEFAPKQVYRCGYCDPDSACGFNGQTLDCSHDECHHPLLLDEARRMAASWNACLGVPIERLEQIDVGQVMEAARKLAKAVYDHGQYLGTDIEDPAEELRAALGETSR